MAQKISVQLSDDLDGTAGPDVTTVLFGLDGVTYEIDLTDANGDRLRELLADYVTAARKTGGRVRRDNPPSGGASGEDTAEVRNWAIAEGYTIATRGRIPASITEAYRAAKTEAAKESSRAGSKRPRTNKKTAAKTSDRPKSGTSKAPSTRKPARTPFSG